MQTGADPDRAQPVGNVMRGAAPPPAGSREVFDTERTEPVTVPVYGRETLAPGMSLRGPALIVEDQTTTVVSSAFDAAINPLGYIVMTRRSAP